MSKFKSLKKLLSAATDEKSTRKALDVGTNDLTKMLDDGVSPEEAMMRLSDVDPKQSYGKFDFAKKMQDVHNNVSKMLGHNQAVARDIPLSNQTRFEDINKLHKDLNSTNSNLTVGDLNNIELNGQRMSPRGFYNPNTNEIAINNNVDPYHALSTYLHENKHAVERINNPELKKLIGEKGTRTTPNQLPSDWNSQTPSIPLEQKVQDSFDHFLEPGYFELRKLLDTVIRNKPAVAGTMGASAAFGGNETASASELTPSTMSPQQKFEEEVRNNAIKQYLDEQRRKLREGRQELLNKGLQESVEILPKSEQVGLGKPFMQTLDAIGTPQQALFRTIEGAQKGEVPDYSKLTDFENRLTGADLVENMNLEDPATQTVLSTLLDVIDPIDIVGAGIFGKGAKALKKTESLDDLMVGIARKMQEGKPINLDAELAGKVSPEKLEEIRNLLYPRQQIAPEVSMREALLRQKAMDEGAYIRMEDKIKKDLIEEDTILSEL